MGRVIFTADDYGAIPAIDSGIIKAVQGGHINSVAAFGNHEKALDKLKLLVDETADTLPEIGCHFTLTSGKPLTKGLSRITGTDGYFRKFTQLRRPLSAKGKDELKALEEELRAQLKVFEKAGIKVHHLSSHHNVAYWFENFAKVVLRVGKELGIPVRSPLFVPVGEHNKFMLQLRIRLYDNLSPAARKAMFKFEKSIPAFVENLPALLRAQMPVVSDSSHYGPIGLVSLSQLEMVNLAIDKNRMLRSTLTADATERPEGTVEFIFHIIDDMFIALDAYKKSTRKTKSAYTGIDPAYFDSRMAEMLSVKSFRLPPGFKFASWTELQTKCPQPEPIIT